MTKRLSWRILSFALVVFVTLETAYWLRPWAHMLRSGGSPYVELEDDGTPVLVVADHEFEGGVMTAVRRIHDESGAFVRSERKRLGAGWTASTFVAAPFWGTHWQHPLTRLGHVLPRPGEGLDWADAVARQLDASQSGLVGLSRDARLSQQGTQGRWWSPFAWTFEDGRFVCHDIRDGRVSAGLGPDGWREGADAAVGERFDRARVALALAMTTMNMGGPQPPAVLVDAERRVVHFVKFDLHVPDAKGVLQMRVDRAHEPIRLSVKSVPVAGPAGEAPAPMPSIARGEWTQFYAQSFQSKGGTAELPAVPVAAGTDLVEVREDGIVRRDRLDPEETGLLSSGSDRFLCSVLAPVGGTVPRIRVRWWRDDGTLVRRDVSVPSVTLEARSGLALQGLATLLRPPLANAASFAGPRVADWEDSFSRWLLDPLVAGGDGGGWLAGSLVVAALCAVLAHRTARLRLGSSPAVWAWAAAGAALGVAALVWMRLVLPRSHVAACACGRRRAVHLPKCPGCAADWPAPAPNGVEVFA
jgi:hypothetical protein